MIGPLILLAAATSPVSEPASAGRDAIGGFKPTSSVSARATASVRIVAGVRFGPGQAKEHAGGQRRQTQLSDADGINRRAELLEFQ